VVSYNQLTAFPRNLRRLRGLKTLIAVGNPLPAPEQARIRAALPNCTVRFE
jgi:hypothetical protein